MITSLWSRATREKTAKEAAEKAAAEAAKVPADEAALQMHLPPIPDNLKPSHKYTYQKVAGGLELVRNGDDRVQRIDVVGPGRGVVHAALRDQAHSDSHSSDSAGAMRHSGDGHRNNSNSARIAVAAAAYHSAAAAAAAAVTAVPGPALAPAAAAASATPAAAPAAVGHHPVSTFGVASDGLLIDDSAPDIDDEATRHFAASLAVSTLVPATDARCVGAIATPRSAASAFAAAAAAAGGSTPATAVVAAAAANESTMVFTADATAAAACWPQRTRDTLRTVCALPAEVAQLVVNFLSVGFVAWSDVHFATHLSRSVITDAAGDRVMDAATAAAGDDSSDNNDEKNPVVRVSGGGQCIRYAVRRNGDEGMHWATSVLDVPFPLPARDPGADAVSAARAGTGAVATAAAATSSSSSSSNASGSSGASSRDGVYRVLLAVECTSRFALSNVLIGAVGLGCDAGRPLRWRDSARHLFHVTELGDHPQHTALNVSFKLHVADATSATSGSSSAAASASRRGSADPDAVAAAAAAAVAASEAAAAAASSSGSSCSSGNADELLAFASPPPATPPTPTGAAVSGVEVAAAVATGQTAAAAHTRQQPIRRIVELQWNARALTLTYVCNGKPISTLLLHRPALYDVADGGDADAAAAGGAAAAATPAALLRTLLYLAVAVIDSRVTVRLLSTNWL